MREALDFKALRSLYDKKAKGYDLQHGLLTFRADERGRRLVVRHGVEEGDRVLDAGGGTGNTALLAAARTGPAGKVVVFDLSEGMLNVAREKAVRADLMDRMGFHTGDIISLPFGDETFDAVLSTYSLCPLYDPAAGALELFRVLKRGGRLAAAHSTTPANSIVRWAAAWVEKAAWRFPALHMGCRPVETLPALEEAGGIVQLQKIIGFPLWPFLVYVLRKPA